ncbi:hypothetical protein PHYBLDRAFT_62194 [Phycomyces blakesleeanus NRRL 1555(-)]|uniref:SWIM-type domain-containing protein n=1 Tax=Phycomyces blakesleeanus (strain ATCC 8743b / DSM 1359 / FGSC 10004 / NBRC 33097 / NRRL 1555) TaxID=763407 RepID=A0A163B9Q2_PHYB8|nr:hypothetical protein PHYBLDRAFT_62194 [Phycomyces blakesleeanus NRRL 1555(-)]OAD79041.1 hypothetical protein PHYBLDRAFT_62194 [Phycomyces blakesleeanus NRRL 1555(-)]|eukprot:XP_018297081.1 hypothetical protein PHYBLDRAFT_62194 [Phycomyces blakesleeanus NRRL 1555(-)]
MFMKRSRNKRLDKLIFIWIHDVEYYLTQEYERVMSNNGAMSSFTRQQRIREMEAEEVDDDARETMIVASVSAENSSWQVQSFVDENTAYVVEVTDRLIMKYTCFDFERRQKPCKHMYLLKMHTAFSLHFSTTPLNPTYEHNVIPIPQPIITNNCSSLFFNQCIQTNQTLHQSHQDLATLAHDLVNYESSYFLVSILGDGGFLAMGMGGNGTTQFKVTASPRPGYKVS